ncbi:hypothetical protein OG689_25930 [Kitasatospora sp. NBC_00240]|uniref:hypothetical protein n=1 Tax=Kitasatospora sp. NBC_00240 TaxID=2903567 RepID=UPI00224F2E98|nr:hypothetical protein [Kitasatospora sp. NBC_00240]MCX5212681.1 hypothetical protein [Kitasatospora sp. NBC_00240]
MGELIWQIEAFAVVGDEHLADHPLPDSFTPADAAALVGDHPDLIGSCFELGPDQLAAASRLLGAPLDPDAAAYFLVARAARP